MSNKYNEYEIELTSECEKLMSELGYDEILAQLNAYYDDDYNTRTAEVIGRLYAKYESTLDPNEFCGLTIADDMAREFNMTEIIE